MPCSSPIISEMLPENHIMEMLDFLRSVIQAQMIYFSVIFVIAQSPMLTFPSHSSRTSDMILSRKLLKKVTSPYSTPVAALNHSPVLPFIQTALEALPKRQWCASV